VWGTQPFPSLGVHETQKQSTEPQAERVRLCSRERISRIAGS